MIKDIIKNILTGIIVVGILTALGVLFSRFIMPDVFFHYSVLEAKWPSKVNFERDLNLVEPRPDTQVMRIFLKNRSKNIIRLSEIKIGGVELFYGSNSHLLVAQNNVSNTPEVHFSSDQVAGQLLLTNLPPIESNNELGIYIWGKFYWPTYVKARSQTETITAEEAVLVVGIEKFFASHWTLILLIFVISFLFLYYFYKARIHIYGRGSKAKE